jgi:hypothetical protein
VLAIGVRQLSLVRTSKSPKRVLVFAYLIARWALPTYAHRCSPKKFTQPQLLACLVFKEFLRLDYRKLAAVLTDSPALQRAVDLDYVPHFTTFQKAAKRLLSATPARRLLDWTLHVGIALRRVRKRVVMAALDGTGFESRHASSYYVRRRESVGKLRGKWHSLTYRRFPKAGILCDCDSHMILAVVPGHGPKPDRLHYRQAIEEARRRVRIRVLAADAGYDSEAAHVYARDHCGIRSLIPALIGRRTDKPLSGYWRRQMKARIHRTRYGSRWQVETVNSMLKRLLDSALRARKPWTQNREIVLRALTLNVMILRRRKVFYRAGRESFLPVGSGEGVIGRLFRPAARAESVLQAELAGDLSRPPLVAQWLAASGATADRFQFSFRLRGIHMRPPIRAQGDGRFGQQPMLRRCSGHPAIETAPPPILGPADDAGPQRIPLHVTQ